MIVFDLRCPADHVFEAWFGSTADYEGQRARGLVDCPTCGSDAIEKAVMAPSVAPKGNSAPPHPLRQLRAAVEESCDWVGPRFAEVARARHAEPTPPARGIYGEASLAEARALLADGIAIAPLPFRPRQRADA